MDDARSSRRIKYTKEELLARQHEREDRIEHTSTFPWTRLAVAGIAAIVAIAATGGGAVSLMVAIMVVIVVMAKRFRPRPPPVP